VIILVIVLLGRITFTELLKESTFSLDFSIDVIFRDLCYNKNKSV